LFAFIVIVAGFVEPVRSPLQPTKETPGDGVAVSVTSVPDAYAPPGGDSITVPAPTTFTVSVKPEPVTVKELALVAVPMGVVTRIGPVVAPTGTVARIWLAESTVKLAFVLLKLTWVAPVKPLPVIVTCVPTGPLPGVKLEIAGPLKAMRPWK
jgi:hypothetical protein